ncbi:single-stranded DNA-binding protein 2 isoform X5 [Scleropages formosus]|uniref:single-stranded DNA-binding protein 2 isoform X5 n=1 Tax=Scleropages formosus TaxID=113540 RepID=UPI0010FA6A33|nr:single-stranded DNA-binding protein 2-like isoform X5 [Scleropages formosus]
MKTVRMNTRLFLTLLRGLLKSKATLRQVGIFSDASHKAQLSEPELALYVYEYLLHVGAQKSAQTFLSEIRWEKNITLGEPPGFLHSWWCVFWDLYCAASERRETCEHSSEAKAFHDYSAAAAPSPVLGNMPPGDGMPVGPVPPGFFQPFVSPRYPGGPRPPLRIPGQVVGGVPGNQPLLPGAMDPSRQQAHPNLGSAVQRMTPPRGMVPLGPQSYGGGMRPPLNVLGGPGMPGMNMGPGGRPWTNPPSANSIPYSSASPGSYAGPPGGGGPPGTPIMPSPADSTNSGENMYTMISTVPPGASRSNFPMGPGGDGPVGALPGMEPHHMNGSLGSGDMDSIPKNSPGNLSLSNQPGTPRDDGGDVAGGFLNPFQSESVRTRRTWGALGASHTPLQPRYDCARRSRVCLACSAASPFCVVERSPRAGGGLLGTF